MVKTCIVPIISLNEKKKDNKIMDVMAEGCPPHIYAHPRGISDCRTKAPEGADELQFNTRVLPSF